MKSWKVAGVSCHISPLLSVQHDSCKLLVDAVVSGYNNKLHNCLHPAAPFPRVYFSALARMILELWLDIVSTQRHAPEVLAEEQQVPEEYRTSQY